MDGLLKLSTQIKNGQLKPSTLLQQTFDRIDEASGLKAIVAVNKLEAQEKARQADNDVLTDYLGPLHGIPMTVKDTFATSHIRTSFGMPFLYRCKTDAELVRRLKAAGAIIVGKSNVPTMSFDWQSRHPRYGTTLNPHNHDYSPGGSSGGAAAAVAAGMVPVELGSDIAGSLRLPASLCGIYTIRPTEGTLSLHGHMAVPMSRPLKNLLTAGPLTNNPEDLALMLRVLSDLEYTEPKASLSRMSVMLDFPQARLSRSVRRVINDAIDEIEKTGILVAEYKTTIDYTEALSLWGNICGYELKKSTFLPVPGMFTGLYKSFFEKRYSKHLFSTAIGEGMGLSARAYQAALERREELMQIFDDEHALHDVMLSPVSWIDGLPNCKTGAPLLVDDDRQPYAVPFSSYNCATAVFGHPITVMPVGYSERGLPVGVQLHGRRYRDFELISHTCTLNNILNKEKLGSVKNFY